jgi:hypothetical protein
MVGRKRINPAKVILKNNISGYKLTATFAEIEIAAMRCAKKTPALALVVRTNTAKITFSLSLSRPAR